MESNRASIHCPLCRSTKTEFKSTLDIATIVRAYRESFGVEIEDFGVDKIDMYACSECCLTFFYPILAGDECFYRQLAKTNLYYMDNKWEFEQALRDILPSDSVLEVGCGVGNFLKKLKNGRSRRVVGIDLNEDALKKARNQGLDVYNTTVEQLAKQENQSFDVVCSFQVLEHVSKPRSFLKASAELLKPRGKLIIGVPNSEGFLKEIRFPLLNMPPHHVTRWNVKAMSYLQKVLPLKIERYSFEPIAHYHVGWYARNKLVNFIEKTLGGRIANYLDNFMVTRKLVSGISRYFFSPMLLTTGILGKTKGHTHYVKYRKMIDNESSNS